MRHTLLVAVQGAEKFWQRMGYQQKNDTDSIKLSSYGTTAFPMIKSLEPYLGEEM